MASWQLESPRVCICVNGSVRPVSYPQLFISEIRSKLLNLELYPKQMHISNTDNINIGEQIIITHSKVLEWEAKSKLLKGSLTAILKAADSDILLDLIHWDVVFLKGHIFVRCRMGPRQVSLEVYSTLVFQKSLVNLDVECISYIL